MVLGLVGVKLVGLGCGEEFVGGQGGVFLSEKFKGNLVVRPPHTGEKVTWGETGWGRVGDNSGSGG